MASEHKEDSVEMDYAENVPAKKKKKSRGGKKKKNAPTGFEEYYVDGPMTPEEARRETEELYASSLPFEQRNQTCIHRFRTRRTLDSELSSYFNEYMFLGGIDTNGAPFNAPDLEDGSLIPHARDDDEATTAAEDDEAARARFYDGHRGHWTVDFAGVAAGFLSESMPPLTGVDPARTDRAINVVDAFLRYVQQHDVCPEHAADVQAARAVCARAGDEWPRLWRLGGLLPGRFHRAAAQTFGVHDAWDWSVDKDRKGAPEEEEEEEGMSPALLFYASLVAAGEVVPKTASGRSDLRLVRRFTCSLALQRVEMPGDAVADFFRRLAIGSDVHKPLGLQSLGRAVFRPTVIEDGWVRQEDPDGDGNALPADEDVVLLWERELLENMPVGIKVTAELCELSSGLRFVKTLEAVLPSFYTFSPQHLIKGYKPPRANDRPPPSIHDRAAAGGEQAEEEPQGGEPAEEKGEEPRVEEPAAEEGEDTE